MEQPLGQTIQFSLSPPRTWLSLGPGWAAVAGALAAGGADITGHVLGQLLILWLLTAPVSGTLWNLAVEQRLWQQVTRANLPPPPERGFYLPYVQAESLGGRLVLLLRGYQLWWAKHYWPLWGTQVVTYGLGSLFALALGWALNSILLGLVVLSLSLTLLAGLASSDLTATSGGRLQTVVQFLLPWLMGAFMLGSALPPLVVTVGFCYGLVYLGALRMLGAHRQATLLFFGGQITVIFLILADRSLLAAVVVTLFLCAQFLLYLNFDDPALFLQKAQLYLILGLLLTSLSMGLL